MDTKRINRRNMFTAVIAVGIAVLAAGCQTMVPIAYTEPARLDIIGVSRIAIISNDFTTTAEVSSALTKTGIYTVTTDESEIAELRKWQEQQALLKETAGISASNLIMEYTSNAARAHELYQGKTVKVTGTVTEIQERGIILSVDNNSIDVYFRRSEVGKATLLDKGATVTMVGTCYGLDKPDFTDTGRLLRAFSDKKYINVTDATFYIPEYTGKIDAVLELETTTSVNDESTGKQVPLKDSEGKILTNSAGKTIYKTVQIYRRVALATVAYRLTRRDGSLIGSGESSGRAQTSYYESRSNLPNSSDLIDSAMKKPLKEIVSDMIPTERTLSLRLAKSKSKDKKLKVSMKEAQILVKEKNYSAAADAYGEIYKRTKDFAAGYNQAIITEAAYGTSEAITLMETLVKDSGNPDAQNMLKAMLARDAANQVSAEQMNK